MNCRTCVSDWRLAAELAFGRGSSPAETIVVLPFSESDTAGWTPGADCWRTSLVARKVASMIAQVSLSETRSTGTRYVAIPRTDLAYRSLADAEIHRRHWSIVSYAPSL